MAKNIIWVVSYIEEDYVGGRWIQEQKVFAFNNEEAANKMYEYYDGKPDHVNVCLDVCEVFNNFFTPEEVENMTSEELKKIKIVEE